MNARTLTIGDVIPLALAAVALACGGGSGGHSTTCADVAAKSVACNTTDTEAYIEQICDRFSCTGSKQAALDCVFGLACDASNSAMQACLSDNKCTVGTDCGTVADAASVCDKSIDTEAAYAACTHMTCTGDSFFAALDCAASFATKCNSTMKSDVNTCFTAQGCSALFQ